jgi:hypothetical protein
LLAASHPLVFTWGQNFWGGGVAMIGGALIVGALARAQRGARWVDGITCGVGLAIVLNSRPFEGTLLILIAAIATRALKRPNQLVAWRFLLPIGALAVLTAGWMAYYNFRVTGSALRLPDMEYTRQYMAAPRFWWMPATPEKSYRHEAIARFHRESEYQEYLRQTTAAGFLTAQAGKIAGLTREWLLRPPYTSILLLPACALAAWRWRRGRWLAAIVIGVPIGEMALTPWFRAHYMAVVMPAFFALATMGLLAINRRNRLLGKLAAGIVVAGQVAAIGFIVRQMIVAPNVAGLPREMAIQRLNEEPGKHLVFVRYEGQKQTIFEWVYNSADIDSQRIIFARDMGEPQNQQLRHYYRDRRAWRAIVRGVEFELIPPQPKK